MAPTKSLFDDDNNSVDGNDDEKKLNINKKYAADFETRKNREELRRVRFNGEAEDDDSSDSESTSSSSEDEEAELLTTKLDVDIFKTINAVRSRDSRIYDPNTRFFEEQADDEDGSSIDDHTPPAKTKPPKPKRYKDVVREQILKKMQQGDEVDSEQEEEGMDERTSKLAYDEQQQEFRKAFLESTKEEDDDGSSSEEEIIVEKKKKIVDSTSDAYDEETQKQLALEIERMKDTARDGEKLIDPKGEIEDGEAFLLDFFKNKPWVQKGEGDSDDSDNGDGDNSSDAAKSLEDLDQADDFEAQYNFRFEAAETQSGAAHSMMSYGRHQGMSSFRRKDETRKERRKARQERKALERKAKEEQLKRLKNAKRQEMEAKLQKVKAVLGEVEGRGGALDEAAMMKLMEGDFDPDKFEELMQEMYNDDFYQQPDTEWTNDQAVRESLKRDEDGELLVGQDDVDGGLYDNQDEAAEEDDDDVEDEEHDGTEEEWPDDDEEQQPKESALAKKMKAKMEDELYKLDYEDIVAGIPTRFKYRQVEPNNYGLTTEEILFARDITLKQFVSLKKMAPYGEGGEHFVGSKKRRRFREMLKHDLEEQEFGHEEPQAEQEGEAADNSTTKEKQKKKKCRRLRKGSTQKEGTKTEKATSEMTKPQQEEMKETAESRKTKRRRRKKKDSAAVMGSATVGDNSENKEEATNIIDEKKPPSKNHHMKTRKWKNRKKIDGVSESRLASYGL